MAEELQSVIRNISAFRLGFVALALLLFVIVTVCGEILRILFLWWENGRYDSRSPVQKAEDMERKLLYFLRIRGIEARLGWNTDAVEAAVIARISVIRPGEYRRICELLQKTIYGGIPLEPYEERTVNYFLRKLYAPEAGSSLFFRWKLRYGIVGYEFDKCRKNMEKKKFSKESL